MVQGFSGRRLKILSRLQQTSVTHQCESLALASGSVRFRSSDILDSSFFVRLSVSSFCPLADHISAISPH
jgi:hypothetical protein